MVYKCVLTHHWHTIESIIHHFSPVCSLPNPQSEANLLCCSCTWHQIPTWDTRYHFICNLDGAYKFDSLHSKWLVWICKGSKDNLSVMTPRTEAYVTYVNVGTEVYQRVHSTAPQVTTFKFVKSVSVRISCAACTYPHAHTHIHIHIHVHIQPARYP